MNEIGRLPWDRKEWARGRIRPNVGTVVTHWIGAIVCGVFGVAAIFGAWEMYLHGDWSNWLSLLFLFPLTGIVLLWYAIIATIKYLRFRQTELWMDQMPGVIGGRFEGRLSFPPGIIFKNKIKVHLVNEEKLIQRRPGDDNGPNNLLEHIYAEVISLNPESGALFDSRLEFPIHFIIPYDTKDETDGYSKKSSSGGEDQYSYRWFMRVTADLPGPNLDLAFTVPIFRTRSSDEKILRKGIMLESLEALDDQLANQLATRTIDFGVGEMGEETIITDRENRFGLLVVCLFLWGIVFFLWGNGFSALVGLFGKSLDISRVGGAFFTFFVFGMLGTGFSLFALIISYWYFDSAPEKESYFVGKELHIRYQLLGIYWEKMIPFEKIKEIKVVRSGSSNGRPFYDVKVFHTMGKPWWMPNSLLEQAKERAQWDGHFPITIASMMYQKEEANFIAMKLKKQVLDF